MYFGQKRIDGGGGGGPRRLILCYESIKSEWITLSAIDFSKIV